MFDDLRDLSDTPLYEENKPQEAFDQGPASDNALVAEPARKKKRKRGNFLGMTAQQRFLISVMLFCTVCLLGTLVMFVMGRMSIF
ncbi:MAG: hypothetical protein HXY42_01305 [Chloroflexi bacterium]|nr:hypothetical protein [Chloroflexota bacterium]